MLEIWTYPTAFDFHHSLNWKVYQSKRGDEWLISADYKSEHFYTVLICFLPLKRDHGVSPWACEFYLSKLASAIF